MPSLMVSLDYSFTAIDQGTRSPTVGLRGLSRGREPCDLPLESFRIREERRPRALTHAVGKNFLVARMMPATIARAASAGEAFSIVITSPILVSIGPG